jgi:hypothetical protein
VVAEAVVDQLEPIHIGEENGVHFVAPTRALDGVIEVVQEEATVRERSQSVMEGVAGELLFEDLALGDVPEGDHRTDRDLAIDDGRCGEGHREHRTIRPFERRVVVTEDGLQLHRPQRGSREKARSRSADGVGEACSSRIAEHLLGGRIGEGEPTEAVHRAHAFAQARGDGLQPVALVAHLLEERCV